MMQQPRVLADSIEHGYIVGDASSTKERRAFHTWCVKQHQPFAFVELPSAWKQRRGAIVVIDLFTTGTTLETRMRFTVNAMAEARALLARYPRYVINNNVAVPSVTPLCIQHQCVDASVADQLARELLALYRRMRANDRPQPEHAVPVNGAQEAMAYAVHNERSKRR
jgi:hypothetical protein